MTLEALEAELSICKVRDLSGLPLDARPCFLAHTDEELSLVCRTEDTPEDAVEREDGWRAFRIAGVLDFSLVGILSKISGIRAGACRAKSADFARVGKETRKFVPDETNFLTGRY